MQDLKRCSMCNLPESYPGINFDENGVCNLCRNYEDMDYTYLGEEKLRKDVEEVLNNPKYKNRPYDAVVAFSGGRDSTYLVNYVKNVLGLNVLAVSLTHDFIPPETMETKRIICDSLGVELKYIENKKLNVYGRKLVRAWSKKPNAPMLVTFCTGCRYGIKKLIPDFCRKEGIPLLFTGDTRMEIMNYRTDILASDPSKPSTLNKMKGFAGNILKNPRLMVSPGCLAVQGYEFVLPNLKGKKTPVIISPMRDYFYLPEDELVESIKDMGWKHNQRFQSTWRADCFINIMRQYYYKRILGFFDQDVHYALLIRQGKMNKEEAMAELMKESRFDTDFIGDILKDYYNLDMDVIEKRIAAKKEK